MTTPNLELLEWQQNQAEPHVTYNISMRVLDCLTQLSVKSRTTNGPPTGNMDGDCYILTATPSGDWADFDQNDVVMYIENSWHRRTPRDGWKAWVQDDAEDVRFLGGSPSGWTPV